MPIYSLGVLLCEMLGGDMDADGPGLIPTNSPHISVGLQDILTRCIAKEPSRRYATATDLAEDLRCHLNDLPLQGVANRSLGERWRKWRQRQPGALGRLVIVVLLLGCLASAVWLAMRYPWATGAVALPTTSKISAYAESEFRQKKFDEALRDLHKAKALRAARRVDRFIGLGNTSSNPPRPKKGNRKKGTGTFNAQHPSGRSG